MSSIFAPASDPLDITLLALPEFSLLSLASTLEPLRAANRASGQGLYVWQLVSPDGRPVVTSSGLLLPVQGRFTPEAVGSALIVLAAFNVFAHATPALLMALRKVARRGIMIGGIESGSWVLALAGLLDGARATTHWEDLEEFAARFPKVDVRPDRFIVDGRRFTTGGASPALDLMLHLIRSRNGYPLALDVASIFIYDEVHIAGDPQPIVSLGRLGSNEPRIYRAIRAMEGRIERPLAIPAIARRAGIGIRSLEMLFRHSVGMSPRDYYLNLRLKAGYRMVLETRKTVTDIAVQTGFASASAFARRFRACFGESPREVRRGRRIRRS